MAVLRSFNALAAGLVVLLFTSSVQGACFTPDGSASTDLSCSSNSSAPSICCRKGFSCTSSHFCIDPDWVDPTTGLSTTEIYIRGTCTDPTWNSPECGNHCLTGQPSNGEMVVHCGDGTFCCTNSTDLGPIGAGCCKNETIPKFDAGAPSVFAKAGIFDTTSTRPSSTAAPTGAASSEGPTSPSTAPSEATIPPSGSSDNSKDNARVVAVGVGVGLPLGLLLVATVVGAIWWTRRLNRRLDEMTATSKANALRLAEMSGEDKRFEAYGVASRFELDLGKQPGGVRGAELATDRHGRAAEMP